MIDQIPDPTKRLYLAVGFLAAHWAAVEFTIDHIIRCVHEEYGGSRLQKSPPVSYNRKPAYLRKAFAAHPDLVQFKPWLEGLLAESNQIAEQRKWCMHGVVVSDEPGQPFSLRKLIHGPEYRDEHRPFTVAQIEKLAQ